MFLSRVSIGRFGTEQKEWKERKNRSRAECSEVAPVFSSVSLLKDTILEDSAMWGWKRYSAKICPQRLSKAFFQISRAAITSKIPMPTDL